MEKSFFVTFNPHSTLEENTALRLQTISNLYNLSIDLPYRMGEGNELRPQTKDRIQEADWVIAFSLSPLSETVKKELFFAVELQKPIIIIYDQQTEKNHNFQGNFRVKEVQMNFEDTEKALPQIAQFLKAQKEGEGNIISAGIACISIGVGMLALGMVLKNNNEQGSYYR